MVQSAAIALAAAFAGIAAAGPIKTKVGVTRGSYTVTQVANPGFKPNGPLQLAKAYNKFGAKMPEALANYVSQYRASLIQKREHGNATTTPEPSDIEYLTPVQIGTPGQLLNMDLDTGSSDLWVFSSQTPKSSVNGQAIYRPHKSSTSKKVKQATWGILYGDGSSSSGDVFHDVFNIGGVSFATQGIESATVVSPQFTQRSNEDGLIGMAFDIINTVSPVKENTFFDNVLDQLDVPAFTADLKHNEPGSYDFGIIDSTKFTGNISYVDVDSSLGFWGFTADINGESVDGIADTGTTFALLPDSVVDPYYNKVQGAVFDNSLGGYTFPCDAELPSFIYTPGDVDIAIPGDFINYSPVDTTGVTCFGGIQSNAAIGLSIYGDIALKAAFVVFDKSESTPRIGFATKDL